MAAPPSHPTLRAILHAAFPGSSPAAPAAARPLDMSGFDEAIERFDESVAGLDADLARFTDLTRAVRAAGVAAQRDRLHGKRVVFTGAGRTAQARAALAATCGFRYGTKVTSDTALVVVGSAGLDSAQRTKAVAAAIPVLDEGTFWTRVGGVG